MTRRARGLGFLSAGLVLGALCAASEWFELAWWSKIRNLGVGPYQHFVDMHAGELLVGRRSTAGFFTRYIPSSGFKCDRINPAKWENRHWFPWLRSANMTDWFSIPIWPLAACLAAGGGYLVLSSGRRPGHCACGYDLKGLTLSCCPECGKVP